MNQMTIFAGPQPPALLPERAQRIRDLVGTARTCIIEIGRELIAASAEVPRGAWEEWLKAEFDWSDRTARKYIAVANAFQSEPGSGSNDAITIDATALYALAGKSVDPELRDAAVEAAQNGTHVTVDEANRIAAELVATRTRELTRAFEERLGLLREQLDELTEAEPEATPPTVEDAVQMLLTLTGRKRLTDAQAQALACALGKPVSYGARTFPPVSPQDTQQAAEALRISSACGRALEYFSSAPPSDDVAAAMPDWLKAKTLALLPAVVEWLDDLSMSLREV
jgi:hypothetical protein